MHDIVVIKGVAPVVPKVENEKETDKENQEGQGEGL